MNKTTAPPSPSRRVIRRKKAVPWLYKLLISVFLFHTLVELIARGTGVFALVRQVLRRLFWVPEGWLGQPLPIRQEITYNSLTTLWSLPFWDTLWWLCGLPALGILAALLLLSCLKRRLSRGTGRYIAQPTRYRNAKAGWLRPPAPPFVCRLATAHRLRRLRNQALPQTETLCRRTRQVCLVQVLSYSGIPVPFHLTHDLAAWPHWSLGKKLAYLSPVYRDLVISRDGDGQIGCFRGDRFLLSLGEGTAWIQENQAHTLSFYLSPPAPAPGAVIQIHISSERKE